MSQALGSMVRHMDLRKGSGFRPLCCLWIAQTVIIAVGRFRNKLNTQTQSARLLKQTACLSDGMLLLQAAYPDSASNVSSHRLFAGEPQEKRLAQLRL